MHPNLLGCGHHGVGLALLGYIMISQDHSHILGLLADGNYLWIFVSVKATCFAIQLSSSILEAIFCLSAGGVGRGTLLAILYLDIV
jgi:hypothetical protein